MVELEIEFDQAEFPGGQELCLDGFVFDNQPVETECGTLYDDPLGAGNPQNESLPSKFALGQNYPNTFNPNTTLAFSLPYSSEVKIKIFNTNGQLIKSLLNRTIPTGHHEVNWDGSDEGHNSVSSGIYLYQMETPEFKQTRRMLLLK
ncbi:MAG: T9SS type A sorting domain-containing protein [Planctomycetes bacterium]|nr:T9SS type A sorting domain-containing protein [Planctomycetota bacterium]